jgi:hypothetical protein
MNFKEGTNAKNGGGKNVTSFRSQGAEWRIINEIKPLEKYFLFSVSLHFLKGFVRLTYVSFLICLNIW